MAFWLAKSSDQLSFDWLKRFNPRFWTVNFSRPMMASVVTTGPDSLSVTCTFYRQNDLCGLIWASEDCDDHPLLSYETDRDYRGLRLQFRWTSSRDVMPLDQLNGPTLTIEGRDAQGSPRSWYVRLWNYAQGSPTDALIDLEFDKLFGGFDLSEQSDPVWAGDIDRLFISLVSPQYSGADRPLQEPQTGHVAFTDMQCTGSRSTLRIGDTYTPVHSVRMATGYDDSYHLTPARVIRNISHLGYRVIINHYVGMSHYFNLFYSHAENRFIVETGQQIPVNPACSAWHQGFVVQAAEFDYDLIFSCSYEILDDHAPSAWRQRAFDGRPALTGWTPPSTLVSPVSRPALEYLADVLGWFCALAASRSRPVLAQIGEPWWWIGTDHVPCIYDDNALAAFEAATGQAVGQRITDAREQPQAEQLRYVEWAGSQLAHSTFYLRDRVRQAHPDARVHLLFYAPQVLDVSAIALALNFPREWAYPAFDVLQLEDYDYVTQNRWAASREAVRLVENELGYPRSHQHYFSGFVLNAADRAQWRPIEAALQTSRERAVAETFVWAYPQVVRDGFVRFDMGGDEEIDSFHNVLFPLELGFRASGGPVYQTQVVTTASGYEQRNSAWRQARLQYDAGLGVRSEQDLEQLLGFFRARRGRAIGFRFRDPLDHSSAGLGKEITPFDQTLGVGDGQTSEFPLVKRYGDEFERRITRPVPESLRVALGGVEQRSGWSLQEGGVVSFVTPPVQGMRVTAGFLFDVPVRFASDELDVSLSAYRAGEVPSVPLIEVREH